MMLLEILILVLLLAVLAALFLLHRKLTRIDLATWELPTLLDDKVNSAELRLYRQIEALNGLNALIRPSVPLPPLRGWAGSPDFLLELARSVLRKKPKTIVECSSGASTIVAARCCQLNGSGHVFSLEHEASFGQATRDRLKEAGLEEWATVLDAPLETHEIGGERFPWYSLAGLPGQSIDALVIDGPPQALGPIARYPAGPRLLPRMSQGALVLVDDADRPGEQEMLRRWSREIPGFVRHVAYAEKGLVILEKTAAG